MQRAACMSMGRRGLPLRGRHCTRGRGRRRARNIVRVLESRAAHSRHSLLGRGRRGIVCVVRGDTNVVFVMVVEDNSQSGGPDAMHGFSPVLLLLLLLLPRACWVGRGCGECCVPEIFDAVGG